MLRPNQLLEVIENCQVPGQVVCTLSDPVAAIYCVISIINFFLVISGPMNYFLLTDRQTDGQTEGDAKEPTVHEHRWAKKIKGFSGPKIQVLKS